MIGTRGSAAVAAWIAPTTSGRMKRPVFCSAVVTPYAVPICERSTTDGIDGHMTHLQRERSAQGMSRAIRKD